MSKETTHELNKHYVSGYPSLQAACKDGYIYGVVDSPLQKDIDEFSAESNSVKISTICLGQSDSGLQEKATEVNLDCSPYFMILIFVCIKAKTQIDGENANRSSLSNNTVAENVTGVVLNGEKRQCSESDLIKIHVNSTVHDQDVSNEVTTSKDDTNSDSTTQKDENGCSRLELLLNASQLISEFYPLPGNEECCDFVFTQSKYDPVTDQSPMFSIDCEWCTCIDGKIH